MTTALQLCAVWLANSRIQMGKVGPSLRLFVEPWELNTYNCILYQVNNVVNKTMFN